MNRRAVISLIGGAAALLPLAARAQQPKLLRIGYLEPGARADPVVQNLRRQFLLGLRDLGYVEGRNFTMEDRSADCQLDRLKAQAVQLVRIPVDVIVAVGEASIRAAREATDKIPIVMTINSDP